MKREPERADRPAPGHLAPSARHGRAVLAVIALDRMTAPSLVCLVVALLSGAVLAVGALTAVADEALLGMLCLSVPLGAAVGWTVPPRAGRISGSSILLGVLSATAANPRVPAVELGWAPATIAATAVFAFEVSLLVRRRLRAAMNRDPLTGLLNRRALRAGADRLLDGDHGHGHGDRGHRGIDGATASRGEHWVIVLDLDGLKPVNDRLGHSAGDRVLRECADAWRRVLGHAGLIGRWGGDEFVVIVAERDRAGARRVLRRLRAATPHPFGAGLAPLTAPGGLDGAVRTADVQLYRDKAAGAAVVRELAPSTASVPVSRAAAAARAALAKAHEATVADWPSALTGATVAAAIVVAVSAIPEIVSGPALAGAAAIADTALALLVAGLATRGARPQRTAVGIWASAMAITLFVRVIAADSPASMLVALAGVLVLAMLVSGFWRASGARALLAPPMIAAVVAVALRSLPGEGQAGLSVTGAVCFGGALASAWALLEVVACARGRLLALVHRDELTGAWDRWGTEDRLEQLVRHARRAHEPLTVVAVDFDLFKRLNDTHGHDRGDAALRGAVAGWRALLRTADVIGRVGGDEFVIALPGRDAAAAADVVNRLRAYAADPWTSGSATLRPRESATALTQRADAALGAAKRAARAAAPVPPAAPVSAPTVETETADPIRRSA